MFLRKLLLKVLWCSVAVVILLAGCASRYRLDLFMATEGYRKKVKVEEAKFIPGTRLNNPYANPKIVPGAAGTVTVTTGTRWKRGEGTRVFMFGFDEYRKCRIYVQLPPVPAKDTIELPGNSFAYLLGRYDLSPEHKVFPADSGTFVVDSVTAKNLFGTIHGRYRNKFGTSLEFHGRFKAAVDNQQ
jgi:hypothetical protein